MASGAPRCAKADAATKTSASSRREMRRIMSRFERVTDRLWRDPSAPQYSASGGAASAGRLARTNARPVMMGIWPAGTSSTPTRSCRSSSTRLRRRRRCASRVSSPSTGRSRSSSGSTRKRSTGPEGAAIFAGNALPEGGRPIAQAYAGHQFGHFTILGDGRAILLGEQITPSGDRVDVQLKGAGQTRFSRRGDGRAALGPMLREYIISEAMHALGIPTTRSLAVVTTGEPVYRETVLDGAVLTRVAASHIRVGTMQWAAAHDGRERRRAGAGRLHAGATLPGARRCTGGAPGALRRHPRTASVAHRPLAAGRLHPRRDEHRQHGALRRNDRLRSVRVHGRLPIPPRCSAPSTMAGDTRTGTSLRSRSGTSPGWPRRCCRSSIRTSIAPWSVPRRRSTASRSSSSSTGSTACGRSWGCSRRKTETSRSSPSCSPGCSDGRPISRTRSAR